MPLPIRRLTSNENDKSAISPFHEERIFCRRLSGSQYKFIGTILLYDLEQNPFPHSLCFIVHLT